ncbi:MAG TPA: hypothetical protein VKR52_17845 [Terracidiphilus sp.]|nr:hypothetical protein [Terracidiphilus sp.]
MAHSFMHFAMRTVEIMFFTGLVGCAGVVVISWISIFKDGFSDLRNKEGEFQWDSHYHAQAPAKSASASATLV